MIVTVIFPKYFFWFPCSYVYSYVTWLFGRIKST